MNVPSNPPALTGAAPLQDLSGHVGALVRAGYGHALHAVIPPGAPKSPTSKIAPDQLGKIPGRWDPAGWHGYNWTKESTEPRQLQRDLQRGGNLGLQTFDVPFVDVDVRDPKISAAIEAVIAQVLGQSPKRTGRAPKFAMPYRLQGPRFGKMLLHLAGDRLGENERIEILADGAQVVIGGIHPGTCKPYTWSFSGREGGVEIFAEVPAASLPPISPSIITERLLPALEERLAPLGVTVRLQGSGTGRAESAPDQDALRAPSLDALRSLITILPNDADYGTYINTGVAIKASAGAEHEADARELWFEWCGRHEGGDDTPDLNTAKWDSFRPPYRLGWEFLQREARRHGINTGADVVGFEADPTAVQTPSRHRRATWDTPIWGMGHVSPGATGAM
ncbi:MAG TPA: PriCT-2 domain-containing protein [Gemmatimonadales bacterium]|nr:PriCT-2 domain-containing protein [Gemmatimonadales bacterium]